MCVPLQLPTQFCCALGGGRSCGRREEGYRYRYGWTCDGEGKGRGEGGKEGKRVGGSHREERGHRRRWTEPELLGGVRDGSGIDKFTRGYH